MIDALCVIGHPSHLGGADTELDHQIRCWQAMGVEVHICNTTESDPSMTSMNLEGRGCVYHKPRDWPSLDGMHCISFCNGDFLSALEEIRPYARTISFVNCMTWNFDDEIKGQENGLIDFHLYQTDHAYEKVSLKLRDLGNYRALKFTPYFHTQDFPFIDDRPQDKFRFGRISRNDTEKYQGNQILIYEAMVAPVLKQGLILGWDEDVEAKVGAIPESYIQVLPAGSISQRAFYTQCEAIIMTTDTYENLPRVGFEAMASGSILVVDNRGGWKLQVEDRVTGWLCNDDSEFVYKASRCAFEHEERDQMRRAARDRLETHWGMSVAMDSWTEVFREWETIHVNRSIKTSLQTAHV